MRIKDNAPEIMLSPSEVANILKVSPLTVREWIQRKIFKNIETVITPAKTYYFVSLNELVEQAKAVYRLAEMTYKYKYPAVWTKGEIAVLKENLDNILLTAGYPHKIEWGVIPAVSLLINAVSRKYQKYLKRYSNAVENDLPVAIIEKLKTQLDEQSKALNALKHYQKSFAVPEDIPIVGTHEMLRIVNYFYPYTADISEKVVITRLITSPSIVHFSFGDRKKKFYPIWSVLYVIKYGTELFPPVEEDYED